MEQMTGLLAQYGLALVFANVFLTQVGVPVPAIPTLIVAGALVQQGQLSAALVLGTAVAGSLLGDVPWFIAGRVLGYRVLNTLCRIAVEPDSCVKQTENIFERWGAPSLVFAKFVPGFSIVAPPIAGALQLATVPFFAYSAIGAAVWAGVAIAAGMIFHAQVDSVLQWLADMGLQAAVVIGLAVFLYVAIKWIERWLLVRWLRMVRISVDELHELMHREQLPVILDARSAAARRLDPRRIPGAIPVDIGAPERALPAAAPDREIIVYCT
jgi:membrane protein DedA with SNARE-associated domain